MTTNAPTALREVLRTLLPQDERIWRLEWIDSARRNPAAAGGHEVQLALREGLAEEKDAPRLHLAWVPIEALPALPLGSLWRRGMCIGVAPAESLEQTVLLRLPAAVGASVSFERPRPVRGSRRIVFGAHHVPPGMAHGYVMSIRVANPRTRLLELRIPLFEIACAQGLTGRELAERLWSGTIDSILDARPPATGSDTASEALHEQRLSILAAGGLLAIAPQATGPTTHAIPRARGAPGIQRLQGPSPIDRPWAVTAVGSWGHRARSGAFHVHRLGSAPSFITECLKRPRSCVVPMHADRAGHDALRAVRRVGSDHVPIRSTTGPPALAPEFERLLEVVELLQAQPDVEVRLVHGTTAIVERPDVVLGRLPDDVPWSRVAGRTRTVMCVQVLVGRRPFYLLRIEPRTARDEGPAYLLSPLSGAALSEADIDEILRALSAGSGRSDSLASAYHCLCVPQRAKSAKARAAAVMLAVKKVLDGCPMEAPPRCC